jgi:hypothetical protein
MVLERHVSAIGEANYPLFERGGRGRCPDTKYPSYSSRQALPKLAVAILKAIVLAVDASIEIPFDGMTGLQI